MLLLLLLVSTVLGFEGRRGLHCSRKTMHRQSERQSDNALDSIPSQPIHRNTEGYHARAYQVQEPIGRYSLVAKADKAGTAIFLDHSNQGCAVRLGRNSHRYDLFCLSSNFLRSLTMAISDPNEFAKFARRMPPIKSGTRTIPPISCRSIHHLIILNTTCTLH